MPHRTTVLLLAVAASSFYNERTIELFSLFAAESSFVHSCNTRPPVLPSSALITGRPRADFPLELFFTICTAAAAAVVRPSVRPSVVILLDRGPSSERRPHRK